MPLGLIGSIGHHHPGSNGLQPGSNGLQQPKSVKHTVPGARMRLIRREGAVLSEFGLRRRRQQQRQMQTRPKRDLGRPRPRGDEVCGGAVKCQNTTFRWRRTLPSPRRQQCRRPGSEASFRVMRRLLKQGGTLRVPAGATATAQRRLPDGRPPVDGGALTVVALTPKEQWRGLRPGAVGRTLGVLLVAVPVGRQCQSIPARQHTVVGESDADWPLALGLFPFWPQPVLLAFSSEPL